MGNRKEDQCRYYEASLQEVKERIADLHERESVQVARALANGHLVYYTKRVEECERTPRQVTLFDAGSAPDDHLEADYDARNGDIGDW